MTELRLCYPLWKLNKYDIEKYSTCLCPNCDSIDVAGGKILKKLGELTLKLQKSNIPQVTSFSDHSISIIGTFNCIIKLDPYHKRGININVHLTTTSYS